MASISSDSKVAYIYDVTTDTWYPTAGLASTSADYSWTGDHTFQSPVTFNDIVAAKAGINNFQNPAERDSALSTTPPNGVVAFVRQDGNGNVINQIQYYSSGAWVDYNSVTVDEKTVSYTIAKKDSNKLIKMNGSSNLELIIPSNAVEAFPIGSRIEVFRAGSGEVSIVAALGSGVTIRSKNNNSKISTQYSGAMITKIGTDEWHLIGDLKA